jgi:hypothetical protein
VVFLSYNFLKICKEIVDEVLVKGDK